MTVERMTEQKNEADRYCPICEQWMRKMYPADRMPTIRREILEEQSSFFLEKAQYSVVVMRLRILSAWAE